MHSQTHSNALAIRTISGTSTEALKYVLMVAFGVALITLSAKMKIPLWPNPTPVTLQTLAIFGIAAVYGSRLSLVTLFSYMAIGAAGLPIFAGTPEKGLGLLYMAGPTGGYLAGFVVMAYITGLAADRGWATNPFKLAGAMLVGEVIMLSMGALWMGYLFGSDKIIAWGIGPFIVTDFIKLAIAACIVPAIWNLIKPSKNA